MRGKTKEEYHKRSVALVQVRRSLLRRGTCDLRAQYVRRNRDGAAKYHLDLSPLPNRHIVG